MKNNVLQALENNAPVDYNGNRKRIFAPLHNFYGFDFNADFDVIQHGGKFTLNAIINAATAAGYPVTDSTVVILIAGVPYRDRPIVARITARGFDIEYRNVNYSIASGVDYVYRKADIESFRKRDDITTYIVMQKNAKMVKPYEKHTPNYKDRFIYASDGYGVSDGRGNSWKYSRVDLITTDGANYRFTYNVTPTNEKSDFIDKSGYLVDIRRENLKNAAENLRRERAAAAFQATDNTAIINALRERVAGLKAAMINALQGVETLTDFNAVERQYLRYSGFNSVLCSFESIVQKDRDKTFGSIAIFNKRVNDLNARIDSILKGGEN